MSYRDVGRGSNSGPRPDELNNYNSEKRGRGKFSEPPSRFQQYQYDYYSRPDVAPRSAPLFPVPGVVGLPLLRPAATNMPPVHRADSPPKNVHPPQSQGANFGDSSAAARHVRQSSDNREQTRGKSASSKSQGDDRKLGQSVDNREQTRAFSKSQADGRKLPPPTDIESRSERKYRTEERRFSRNDDVDSARHRENFSDDIQSHSHHKDENKSMQQNYKSRSEAGKSQKTNLSLEDLMQDERLKSVLFAGISKATAKLEQSLKDTGGGTSEKVALADNFLRQSKSQLLPSSSADISSGPKSILKRKTEQEKIDQAKVDQTKVDKEMDSSNNETLNKLSALERTLHLLRGKANIMTSSDRSEKDNQKQSAVQKGALGQLSSYDDSGDDTEIVYKNDTRKIQSHTKQTAPSSKPFWSVGTPPAVKATGESFEDQEKLFEQWRQSINRGAGEQKTITKENKLLVNPLEKKNVPPRDPASSSQSLKETDDNEELDSTVQNILHSIGFNFDLSKRMQELARLKKKQLDTLNTGNINQSASFLGNSENLMQDVRAALFSDNQEETDIKHLIKVERVGTQKDGWSDSSHAGTNFIRGSRSPEHIYRNTDEQRHRRRPTLEYQNKTWEKSYIKEDLAEVSSEEEKWSESGLRKTTEKIVKMPYKSSEVTQRSFSKERDVITFPHSRHLDSDEMQDIKNASSRHSERSHWIPERLTDEPKSRYSPQEREYAELFKSVPHLLTRIKEVLGRGDLQTMLLPSDSGPAHVEDLRVTSRADYDDESFGESSRRVVIASESDQRDVTQPPVYRGSRSPVYSGSRSPVYKESKSPERRIFRKRSASPLTSPAAKERRVFGENTTYSQHHPYYERPPEQRESLVTQSLDHNSLSYYTSSASLRSSQAVTSDSGLCTSEGIKPPIMGAYIGREITRKSLEGRTSRSPFKSRSRSLSRHTSRSPGRQRSRSPGRQRSRSRSRQRSRSRSRRQSRSRSRQRSKSRSRRRSKSHSRRRSKSCSRRRSRSHSRRRSISSHRRRSRSSSQRRSRSRSRLISRSPGRQKPRFPVKQKNESLNKNRPHAKAFDNLRQIGNRHSSVQGVPSISLDDSDKWLQFIHLEDPKRGKNDNAGSDFKPETNKQKKSQQISTYVSHVQSEGRQTYYGHEKPQPAVIDVSKRTSERNKDQKKPQPAVNHASKITSERWKDGQEKKLLSTSNLSTLEPDHRESYLQNTTVGSEFYDIVHRLEHLSETEKANTVVKVRKMKEKEKQIFMKRLTQREFKISVLKSAMEKLKRCKVKMLTNKVILKVKLQLLRMLWQ